MTLAHFFGLDSLNDVPYAFWSGAGSVFLPFILQAVVFLPIYWYHHNCNHSGCPRIGKHHHNHFRFCKYHHPLIKDTK
jgi:hypothetical protein